MEGTGVDGVMALAGWSDLPAEVGPACLPPANRTSQIDQTLANRAAKTWLTGATLCWGLGLATHATL
eukprot:10682984-Lingulodinium_polyedra.AAC.1